MAERTFYITTPIYYPSDNLHIGHAYTTVAADCVARFERLRGKDVYYLTGTDEHGQKIERVARGKGQEPLEYLDHIVADIRNLWHKLMISNTDFIRTTEPRHQKVVQELFQKVYDRGDIYRSEYEGWYCTPCETFFTERQLQEGNCPDCGRKAELIKEESYFFRMQKYADRLLQHIEEHPDFIQPESRKNEVVSFIKGGLDDLCVSRTTFQWGIPVPFDKKHVVYVWFDALINYISAITASDEQPGAGAQFKKYWPEAVHFMAKDIIRFHGIIWPIMLMAMDLPLPRQIFAHGWILLAGGKMSKSKGNVVDPLILIDKYGVDAVRYFLLREMTYGQDGQYSEPRMVQIINTDLANDFGNLLSRTLAMIDKYFAGVLPAPAEYLPLDEELQQAADQAWKQATAYIEKFDFSNYLQAVNRLISRANKYIDETEPWILARQEEKKARLGTVMYVLSECLRVAVLLLSPALPTVAARTETQIPWHDHLEDMTWADGELWGLGKPGLKVQRGDSLFPRIDDKAKTKPSLEEQPDSRDKAAAPRGQESEPGAELISIDDFAKLDLRVAEVMACEKMKNADKLLKLTLRLGEEIRTVVSGIAQHYTPEDLVGKKVVLVANLQPVKLRGVMSQGMILAASDAQTVEVLLVNSDIASGNRVK